MISNASKPREQASTIPLHTNATAWLLTIPWSVHPAHIGQRAPQPTQKDLAGQKAQARTVYRGAHACRKRKNDLPRDKAKLTIRRFRSGLVLKTATTAATLPAGAVSRDRGDVFDAADLAGADHERGARLGWDEICV